MKISIGVGVRKLGQHRLADSGYSASRGWRSDLFYSRRGLRGAGSSPARTILFLSANWDGPLPFQLPWELAPPGDHTRKCLSPPSGRCDRTDPSLQFPLRPSGPVTSVHSDGSGAPCGGGMHRPVPPRAG